MNRLGIVVALPEEARPLLGRRALVGLVEKLEANSEVLVAVGGLGAERAARAALRLADAGCASLLSWGTAGGLDTQLKPGTLVLPPEVVDETGQRHAVDAHWHARLIAELARVAALVTGRLLSVRAPLLSAAAKQAAQRSSGACAVDMESAAIATVAAERELPFAAVRVIVDAAGLDLPHAVQAALREDGRVHASALAGALLRRPADIPRLLRLARDFAAAKARLGEIASAGRGTAFWSSPCSQESVHRAGVDSAKFSA